MAKVRKRDVKVVGLDGTRQAGRTGFACLVLFIVDKDEDNQIEDEDENKTDKSLIYEGENAT